MSEPRWLDDTEMRAWRGLIALSRLLVEQLGRELNRDAGMSIADYEVLVQLSESEGRRLRMRELAAMSLVSRSRLSHQMGRLEEAGWVRRESCPSDRRGAFAVLTDAGLAALEAAAPGHLEGVRRHVFDHLDAGGVAQLAAITTKLADELNKVVERDCAAPKRDGAVA
jgi:DNA-binding MarR family transcriptional regulator